MGYSITPKPGPSSLATLIPAQRQPCKPWCATHDSSIGEDICQSADIPTPGGYIQLTHERVGGTLFLLNNDPDNEFTADEFEQLAMTMLAQVAIARAATHRPAPGCQPWCNDHMHDDEGPGTCVAADATPAGCDPSTTYVGLSHNDDGTRLDVDTDRDRGHTLDQGEQIALAILRQVATGRAALAEIAR